WLASLGAAAHDVRLLMMVVSADNLAGGMASSAFIAYLSGLTQVAYSATQYALFSSLMQLLPKSVGTLSGLAVDTVGYANFFLGSALLGLPVIILVGLNAYLDGKRPSSTATTASTSPDGASPIATPGE
ncbi:MAG TPA: permease, partial [Burkholderiaceae bacterium]|nr:permease [Burkholderiaceae bacterium]